MTDSIPSQKLSCKPILKLVYQDLEGKTHEEIMKDCNIKPPNFVVDWKNFARNVINNEIIYC